MHGAKGDWKKTHREIMHAIKVNFSKTQSKLICYNYHENPTFYAKLLTIFADKIICL
jgi:hypothetical protein